MADTSRSAFFYGTLMHPKILKRVIGNEGDHLQICPAILLEYTRHHIKYADYPGIVPYTRSRTLFNQDLSIEERSVRGTLVTGLSKQDIDLLDVFEGDEYARDQVLVHPLAPLTALSSSSTAEEKAIVPSTPPPVPTPSHLSAPVGADTYVWKEVSYLNATLWSFEDFVKNNAWKWVGSGSEGNRDYVEVDRRRGMNGNTMRSDLEGAV